MKLRITKYFDKNVLPFVEQGSFRFGTLQSYRAKEGEALGLDRMSDDREGLVQNAIFPAGGRISYANIGGNTFVDCGFTTIGGGAPIMAQSAINDFIFCASLGGYDREHHEKLLEKNPDLSEYAVIDLDRFLKGIRFSAPHQTTLRYSLGHPWLLHKPVRYGSTQTEYHVPSTFNFDTRRSSSDEYERTVFCKPERFSHEKEFRVVIRPYAPACISTDEQELILKHRKLQASILHIGSIIT